MQSKKEAEEQAQRELNELFAEAIKQPKVPNGKPGLIRCYNLLLMTACHEPHNHLQVLFKGCLER